MSSIEDLEKRVEALERRKCCCIKVYDTSANFPSTGQKNTLYIDKNNKVIYLWDGSSYIDLFANL